MNRFIYLDSFVKLPREALYTSYLTVYEKAVVGYLACYSEPFPSLVQISDAVGVNRKTVMRALHRLRVLNVVTWEQGKNGQHNYYTLNPPDEWRVAFTTQRDNTSF